MFPQVKSSFQVGQTGSSVEKEPHGEKMFLFRRPLVGTIGDKEDQVIFKLTALVIPLASAENFLFSSYY